MIAVLALAIAAVATQASALPFGDRPPAFHVDNMVRNGLFARMVPLNPFHADDAEVREWMNAVGPITHGPVHLRERPGPSIYDDYHPPDNVQAAASRTLWFEEFPHKRAVLNWQQKRANQGLPLYKLVSQRPGFPFYAGN
ncbi:uncharacterized protein LOC119108640 [Pollicipes pollicipes]|uniref:uncharacterized protein LOC119108640 n=1 Tax=Pollicipes pollicipes TaxID=41117 RepID=UPI001884A400|nr:uncharacterized protein LOC119108640 [Pollicipes pollicipes]